MASETLEREGFVVIKNALPASLAAQLLKSVDAQLVESLAEEASGKSSSERLFGAIAPPAAKVANRWNVLLPLNGLMQTSL